MLGTNRNQIEIFTTGCIYVSPDELEKNERWRDKTLTTRLAVSGAQKLHFLDLMAELDMLPQAKVRAIVAKVLIELFCGGKICHIIGHREVAQRRAEFGAVELGIVRHGDGVIGRVFP